MMLPEGLMVQNVGGSDVTFYSLCISGGRVSSRPEAQVAIPNKLATLMYKKSVNFFFVYYLCCTEFLELMSFSEASFLCFCASSCIFCIASSFFFVRQTTIS